MAALEVAEMNKIVREVFGNPNKQNRSALTPEQIRRYVDDVIASLPGAPEKGLLLEFLLKLLVFDVDVQAQFIVNRGLLDKVEGLELAATEVEATRKKNLILYVVRKLLGKDVVQFGDDFIFELKKANQKLLALVIGPDELPASSAYLYHKYLSSVLDVVELRTNAVQKTLGHVLENEEEIKLSIVALRAEVLPLSGSIRVVTQDVDSLRSKFAALEALQEKNLHEIRDALVQLAATFGEQLKTQKQETHDFIEQQGAAFNQKIDTTTRKLTELENSLATQKVNTDTKLDQLTQRLDSLEKSQVAGQKRLEELIASSIASLEEKLKLQIAELVPSISQVQQGLDKQQQQVTHVIETVIPELQQKIAVEVSGKIEIFNESLAAVREDLQEAKDVVLELAKESNSVAQREIQNATARRQAWEQTELKLGGRR